MSRFHVDPNEPADIPEDGDTGNVITIRARMNVDVFGQLKAEIKKRNAAAQTEGNLDTAPIAMLLHNILGWRGPDFDDLPCTPDNILALPPAELDPFIEKVVNAIADRNRRRESPNGRSPAIASTPASAGASDLSAGPVSAPPRTSLQSVTGMSASPLRNAITGHLSKSAD